MPAQTTLAANMLIGDVVASVRDTLGFAGASETNDLVLCGTEYMLVAGGLATNSWTSITRGYAGSSAAAHTSGDTITRILRDWTDLTRIQTRTGIAVTDTTDNAQLLQIIDAVNGQLSRLVGGFLGPSTNTVRTYDGRDAVQNGRRLWVPGGIRTLSAVRLAYTGGSLTSQTIGDFILGPVSANLRPDQPYNYVEFIDVPTGGNSYFPNGKRNVELTGTFGYAEQPNELQDLADTVVVRKWKARDTGWGVGIEGTPSVPFFTAPELAQIRPFQMEHEALVR